MYRKTTLPSGLRVLTEAMPAVRSVSIGIWADVGSSLEAHDDRGISHLVEHMLFKGTQRRSARAIAETMDGVGGNLNAFTDKESTCYYAKVIDRHAPLAMDVLGDMFLNSTFDPDELGKEQKVVLEEIKMYEDSPDELIHDLFLQTMWSGANLGEPTIGFADTVVAVHARRFARAHAPALRAQRRRRGGGGQSRARTLCRIGGTRVRRVRRRLRHARSRSAEDDPEPSDPPQGLRAGVRGRRNARSLGARRAALRAFAARYAPWRRNVEPALPRDPRETGTRLHGLFVSGRLSRGRALWRVRRNFARKRAVVSRPGLRTVCEGARSSRRLEPNCGSPRNTSRGTSRSRSSRRRAA